MRYGKSIRIHLKDGTISGIRHSEVMNRSAQAVACPRGAMADLGDFYEELPGESHTGIYFLFGEEDGRSKAYIGESEDTSNRILRQAKDKEWWTEAVILTSKDQILTKAHALYLERKCYDIAANIDRFILDQDTPSGASLAPADSEPMDEFAEDIRLLLGAFGYRILEPKRKVTKDESSDNPLKQIYRFSPRGAEARGELTDEGFVVHEGSTAVIQEQDSLREVYRSRRNELVEEGSLQKEDKLLEFQNDIVFNSPSFAANIIAGSPQNGREVWCTERGKPLGKLQDEFEEKITRRNPSEGT